MGLSGSVLTGITLIASILTIWFYASEIKENAVDLGDKILGWVRTTWTNDQLFDFWKHFRDGRVTIIMARPDPEDITNGTQIYDFLGCSELISNLQDEFDDFSYKIVLAESVDDQSLNTNLIVIGGPIANGVTKEILKQPEVSYWFGSEPYSLEPRQPIMPKNGNEPTFSPETNGKVSRDYGIITRCKNPYNTDYDAIVFSGGYGWGTRASCQLTVDSESLSFLNKNLGEYFQAITRVDVDENDRAMRNCIVDETSDESNPSYTISY